MALNISHNVFVYIFYFENIQTLEQSRYFISCHRVMVLSEALECDEPVCELVSFQIELLINVSKPSGCLVCMFSCMNVIFGQTTSYKSTLAKYKKEKCFFLTMMNWRLYIYYSHTLSHTILTEFI